MTRHGLGIKSDLMLLGALAVAVVVLVAAANFQKQLPPIESKTHTECSSNGCSGHVETEWGYCQYETHQTKHTFQAWLEIGIRKAQTAQNSRCTLPFQSPPAEIISSQGNIGYLPFTKNVTSMVARVETDGGEYLHSVKLATVNQMAISTPVDVKFTEPVKAKQLIVVFNDDLENARPTVINVGLSGELQPEAAPPAKK
jgi:hypothetical protein